MRLLNLTESERLEILNLHNNARIIKEQATPEVPSTAATVEDVIKQIQTTLNTKYGTKLTVDGKWGDLTQTAFETAAKLKAAPAAEPTTGTPAAAPTGTPAAAPTVQSPATSPVVDAGITDFTDGGGLAPETQAAPQSNRDQRRERQDLRRGNRRATQDLRAGQRGQQQ